MARKMLWTFFVVVVGVGLLFGAGLNQAHDNRAEPTTVTNESITVDYTQSVPVDKAGDVDGFDGGATVFNASGAELVNGTDYEWHPSNGSVTWINTTATSSGEDASITYTFFEQSEADATATEVGGVFGLGVLFLSLLLAGKFVIGTIGGMF